MDFDGSDIQILGYPFGMIIEGLDGSLLHRNVRRNLLELYSSNGPKIRSIDCNSL